MRLPARGDGEAETVEEGDAPLLEEELGVGEGDWEGHKNPRMV